MSRIPDETIERIRAAVDIVDIIGERVDLTRRGKNWIGLCPFHVEKTPSFNVNPEYVTFKCFGCGQAGSVFSFLMQYEQLSFREAVVELGRATGIPVEIDGAAPVDDLAPLRAAVEWAARMFAGSLWSPAGERAQGYLKSRGFEKETLQRFGVGYAPDSWSWLVDAARRDREGPDEQTMVKVGLARARDNGGVYDFYRDRVIFPIVDRRGRPIAFGGRIMPDNAKAKANPKDVAKYFNSPESALYQKSGALYGYYQARDAIRRSSRAIVAEGYTDVIMAHQSGICDVVACCGTALTDVHARTLARASKQIVFLFDGDQAGQRAAEKSLDAMLPLGREVSVVALPDGADPHEFLLAYGPDAFDQALGAGRDTWAFKLDALAMRHDMRSPAGKAQAIDELIKSLNLITNPVERELQGRDLARFLGIDPRTFSARREQRDAARPATGEAPAPAIDASGLPPEAFLLEVIAHRSDLAQRVIREYPLGRYRNEAVHRVATVLYARLGERGGEQAEPHPGVGALIALLEDPADARLLHAAAERTGAAEELDKPLSDFLGKSAMRERNRRSEALKAELRIAEQARDSDRISAILKQLGALMKGAS